MREETKLIRAIQWKKIIDEQLASGLNQTAWCQVNNISRNTFKNWKSRLTEYTLQELNTKATELGIPVSGSVRQVTHPYHRIRHHSQNSRRTLLSPPYQTAVGSVSPVLLLISPVVDLPYTLIQIQ